MILGGTCTRACKFCNVKTGNPKKWLDLEEPKKTAEMAKIMGLNYMVVTSVDRDDLDDFGASHFAKVVERIRKDSPRTKVEVLIPDFDGEQKHMHTLAQSEPFVIAQNVETVKGLPTQFVTEGQGMKSLDCLEFIKSLPHITTKTSLMVGLGETWNELLEAMDDIRKAKVDIITFGQYLRPTQRHLKVRGITSQKI